ncbi:PLDc N-terminal domain-containing protein [Microbacterium aurantiacum]|uniref:PLDc N-terminal domain-containing protein n=1 Tax=Microbacterium aurantiacum TaxID=162393 RepID=UPI0040362A23
MNLVNLDTGLLAAFMPPLILAAALIILCLIDITLKPRVRHFPTLVWVLLVVLLIPLGAVLYLIVGRERGAALRDEDIR